MKIIISILVFLAVFLFAMHIDGAIVDWMVGSFPKSAAEWLGVIRIACWILMLSFTLGFSILISYAVSYIIYSLLDGKKR
jgi:hypothetical protein